jgi:non-specific serine/threonine protein kinase
MELLISPHGHLALQELNGVSEQTASGLAEPAARRIGSAFARGQSAGLLHLATVELQTALPVDFGFARDFGRAYLTQLCRGPGLDGTADAGEGGKVASLPALAPPAADELGMMALSAPPMRGLEYLNADVLAGWWRELDEYVRGEISDYPGGAQAYLREKNPLWRQVGRVTFHLAENKRDPGHPFAFLATYATRVSALGRVQHQPLGRALQEYAGAKDRSALLSLLKPIQRAAERSELARNLADSNQVYRPLAWTPTEAYRFLQDIPLFEESGLIVQVPNWWKANRPPRPTVSVTVGGPKKSTVGADALLDFSVAVTLEGEQLTDAELRDALANAGGLVWLRGKWVEVDREKLNEALKHWKQVERDAGRGGVSFFEGMRLLAGAPLAGDAAAEVLVPEQKWTGIKAGAGLEQVLKEIREPPANGGSTPPGLRADLREYQKTGVNWLRFMTRLGLGACLADDMGLGKTIQVIALLLHAQRESARDKGDGGPGRDGPTREEAESASKTQPALLIVPASLIANWKAEIARFAPSLSVFIAHPSEMQAAAGDKAPLGKYDLVITTYGMLSRLTWAREREWGMVILDEAQAIKNSGSRQTRAVKELKGSARIALTGTPVENRLSDLWSLFDFLNPGLLGGAKAFSSLVKKLQEREHNPYAPLRALVRPYILRRLKTDKRVIADLPDKIEANAFCGLSKLQAAMYQQLVDELAEKLKHKDVKDDKDQDRGIQRRGIVLAYLMRLKQVCNHPSQVTREAEYPPQHSGKFKRLGELCEELAQRQEKVLVFTQFREITAPLAEFLSGVFGRAGVVLHGGTSVGKRRELVEAFQREQGPPFFVLSLKAGGTGLNLTAASHVIHFDRWWNPAVENQATDRAFRIGQKKNVFVHKFVCQGTVEDRIDALIAEKTSMVKELLDDAGGAEKLLTEMDNDQLLRFVSLDAGKALEA